MSASDWDRVTATERVVHEIWRERDRQVAVEGWTLEHDDRHAPGVLTRAALNYAGAASICLTLDAKRFETAPPLDYLGSAFAWPWDDDWWKPKEVRADLIRAAALIVAEIERMDRASERRG